jgi:hypothetical protein
VFGKMIVRGLSAAAVVASAVAACHGEFVVDFEQSGSNVVATGGGTINLTALPRIGDGGAWPGVGGAEGDVTLGADSGVVNIYSGLNGPQAFGTLAGGVYSSAASGDTVALFANMGSYGQCVGLSFGYISGAWLSNTTTWDDTTVSGLGLTPGTYTWTWGSGATADSFVMNISQVPEPTTLTLLGSALLGLGVVYLRRRRAKA